LKKELVPCLGNCGCAEARNLFPPRKKLISRLEFLPFEIGNHLLGATDNEPKLVLRGGFARANSNM